ncbi:hypothetical protein FB451DRAFT_1563643 [Mycena latifolia]|nr:hypothetical protein FB451DRAFT_1563643 [Mycena latifolia]
MQERSATESSERIRNLEASWRQEVVLLEQTNEDIRRSASEKTEYIQKLEAERISLRQEIQCSERNIKIKKDQYNVKIASNQDPVRAVKQNILKQEHDEVPNTALIETRQRYRDEHRQNGELQKKCAAQEKKLQESVAIAAKALRERIEVEKRMEGIIVETQEFLFVLTGSWQVYDARNAANTATIAAKSAIIKSNVAELEILRGKLAGLNTLSDKCSSLEAQKASLTNTLSDITTKYDSGKIKNAELNKTCGVTNELVVGLELQVKESTDRAERYRSKYTKIKSQRTELREKVVDLEGQIKKLTAVSVPPMPAVQPKDPAPAVDRSLIEISYNVAHAEYRKYMKKLPTPVAQPELDALRQICKVGNRIIHARLTLDLQRSDSDCSDGSCSIRGDVLYLPGGRIFPMSRNHYIVFSPTQRYHAGTWAAFSDQLIDGSIRELFIQRKKSVSYIGTYKCHDLSRLCPGGTMVPPAISQKEIRNAAGLESIAKPDDVIPEGFPDGVLRVKATGLQCIGFDHTLYDALRPEISDGLPKGEKRKNDDKGGKEPKKRRRYYNVPAPHGEPKIRVSAREYVDSGGPLIDLREESGRTAVHLIQVRELRERGRIPDTVLSCPPPGPAVETNAPAYFLASALVAQREEAQSQKACASTSTSG